MIRENKMNYNQWHDLILFDLTDVEKQFALDTYNEYATLNNHKGEYVYVHKHAYVDDMDGRYTIDISLRDDNPELEAYKTIGWYAKIRSNNTIAHFEDIFDEFSKGNNAHINYIAYYLDISIDNVYGVYTLGNDEDGLSIVFEYNNTTYCLSCDSIIAIDLDEYLEHINPDWE